QATIDEIKRWYDGYSWDGKTSVYNPFSTLQLFNNNQFIDYWFASGTPTFLVNLIRERNDVATVTKPFEMSASGFDAFEITTLNTRLLLFQTGYLTVKNVQTNMFDNVQEFVLGIPNEEVRRGLLTYLLSDFSQYSIVETPIMRNRMMKQLFDGDATALENSLREMFARIPYQLHVPLEAYLHSLFLLWLNLLGFKVDAEVQTNIGRLDAVWTWAERVVIAEVKYSVKGNVAPLLDEAMSQIRKRRYWERYGKDKRIAILAVAFAGKEIGCRMEELKCEF
ncbi:MAG: PD-(D/E)XK nuclease domain-containing protein, partial [Prevotellaceae bacterium]|nr:PD-(D/E)XK nuclease domain-containing protein [Prevotellaceae bacterium]